MTRRCSHCSHNGHNSRTCPSRVSSGGGVRLFGVMLTDGAGAGAMKKSASMSCIVSAAHGGAMDGGDHACDAAAGYVSDDPSRNCRTDRKRGIAWTEEEHRMFLQGLQKLGKGDWRGIARNYVVSRTPTQVASHAQKYFIRQTNASRRKRRVSLFDMVPETPIDQVQIQEENFLPHSPPNEIENTNQLPPQHPGQPELPEIVESSSTTHTPESCETILYKNSTPITVIPTFFPAYIPVPMPFWPAPMATATKEEATREYHNILKPTPLFPKETPKVDEVVSMSKLSIGEVNAGRLEPSALSLKLLGGSSSRPSAFHHAPSVTVAELNQPNGSPIHAV